jgi:hypothetical protein
VEFCTKDVPKELVLVTYDDCTYDNICIAGIAGFLENDCEPVDQEVEPADPNAILISSGIFECPEKDPDIVCRMSLHQSFATTACTKTGAWPLVQGMQLTTASHRSHRRCLSIRMPSRSIQVNRARKLVWFLAIRFTIQSFVKMSVPMGTCVLVSEQAFSKAIAYPKLVKCIVSYDTFLARMLP